VRVVGEEAEELKFELLERLEDAYRLPVSAQVLFFAIAEILLFSVLYYFREQIQVLEATIIFLLGTALIYPITIKVRNFYTELLAAFIYGSFMAGFTYYLIYTLVEKPDIKNPSLWMLLVFVLVFGTELFHHIHEKARTLRTRPIILADIILTAIFCFSIFMLLWTWEVSTIWSIIIAIFSGMIYAYAILPEKPY